MKEYDLIKHMVKGFKKSPYQHNKPFECDAELVNIDGKIWAMSIDDFSPDEDFFTSEDPSLLGSNLVTATLSDLFAAGAEPRFFLQNVSLPKSATESFTTGLMDGVRTTLEQADCALCGGDFGTAKTWRYSGFALGPVKSEKPLTRCIPEKEHTLWVTGTLGDANLAAFQDNATPRFELRLKEAEVIRKYATACIDTSGGLMDAVWLIHEQSENMRLNIDIRKVPFSNGIIAASIYADFPPEAALIGGAGEYELLFTVPAGIADKELARIGATAIGNAIPGQPAKVELICMNGKTKTMHKAPPCPREAPDTETYIKNVIKTAIELFHE